MFFRNLFLVAAVFYLSACSTMDTVESSEDIGSTKIFSHSFDNVSAAALETVQALNVSVKKTQKVDDEFQIYFSKAMSVWSWGEVGKLTVRPIEADSTLVGVSAEKRYKIQVTGTSEAEFSDLIFTGIEKRLTE